MPANIRQIALNSVSAVSIAAMCALAAPAYAQEEGEDEADREVITVTVERREVSIQDLAGTATSLMAMI